MSYEEKNISCYFFYVYIGAFSRNLVVLRVYINKMNEKQYKNWTVKFCTPFHFYILCTPVRYTTRFIQSVNLFERG